MRSYHEVAGVGGANVAGQVEEQRARIARSLAGVRHRVAVGSGKGGVGKSTVTLGIASELRRLGLEIAILDADLNGPSQGRLAGVLGSPLVPGPSGAALPRSRSGIGVFSVGAMLPESEALDFASVAGGDSHVWRATREFSALGEILAGVDWGRIDVLLFDLPPGAERTLQYAEFLGPATSFVLVTIPSALARGVVARSVAALRGTPNRLLGYVENMKGYACPGCGEVHPLFADSAEVELGIPCLGSVPFDPVLAACCERGPASDAGPASGGTLALRGIADRVMAALEGER